MIERYENAIQIAVLILCAILAASRAARYRSRSWVLLSFFYGSWLLGDIYWLACLLFFGTTPQISVISDLSWYAAYIFLYLLLCHVSPPQELPGMGTKRIVWLGPALAVGMAVFFIQWGEILSNLIYAGLMGLLLYAALRRLTEKECDRRECFLPAMILLLCLLEYALWTASCFLNERIPLHPYYWFDLLLTVSFPLFLPATRKAVKA